MKRRVLDVSGLPKVGFGTRDPLWWGMHLLNAIEGTMLVLAILAYGYVRARTPVWPPVPVDPELGWRAAGELGILLVATPPMVLAGRAAIRADLLGMRRWLLLSTALAAAGLVVRVTIFADLPFRWDEDAFTSTVWTVLGLQTFHLASCVVEQSVFVALLYTGPIEQLRRPDLHASTLLWYFVVAGAALQWAVIFVDMIRAGGA